MRTLFTTLLLALVFATSAGQSGKPPFSIAISGPRTIKAGASLEIKVVLTNTSDQRVDFRDHSPEEFNYSTEVLNSNRERAEYTSRGHFMVTRTCNPEDVEPSGVPSCAYREQGPGLLVSLQAGRRYTNWIQVTDQFRMSEPGDYAIQVIRTSVGPQSQITVKSNTITVTVTP